MITIQQAIEMATDGGIVVTDKYSTKRKGEKVGAFKCVRRNPYNHIEIKQTAKGSRTWTICQRGFSVFYGSQGECIEKAVQFLTNNKGQ